jgi:hypothetical protein
MMALSYRITQLEGAQEKQLRDALEAADRISGSGITEDQLPTERLIIDSREKIMRSLDANIDFLKSQIERSVGICEPGVRYDRSQDYGKTVLKCEGISPAMFKICLI